MNSRQRDAFYDVIENVLCPPLFYIGFRGSSTIEKKGRKFIEHFSVEVTVGIRPVVISDYKRSIVKRMKRPLIFAAVTVLEKEVVAELLGRVAGEIGLFSPRYVAEKSGEGLMVFKFQ
jgi:hypothetical protein